MTYAANNPLLYNAALAGIAAAAVAGTNPGGAALGVGAAGAIAAANAANLAAAVTIAQAIDTSIAADSAANGSTSPITLAGATIIGTASGDGTDNNFATSKANAMRAVAYAELSGQGNISSLVPVAGAVAAIAASVKAKYSSVITAPFSLV